MAEYIVKTNHNGGFIEVERALSGAIRSGAYEFNGYNVFAQGTWFRLFEAPPVDDPQAPADFVTETGGRYNAKH